MSKSDEHYADMANMPYDKPCLTCGAECRTEKGHDPCIPDLPGVLHACCGHGRGDGYVMFEDGTVLRGEFDDFARRESNRAAQIEWGVIDD